MSAPLRVIGTLLGDIRRKPDMKIKYGGFFKAVGERFDLLDVYDASLVGWPKYWNALQTFSPSIPRWKARFFKNVPAFEARSLRAQKHFRSLKGRADVILQLGALFDGTFDDCALPVVLYTDNTSSITAQHAISNIFSDAELKDWMKHESSFYHRAAHICTRANIVKRSLVTDYGVLADRISVIGGGISFSDLTEVVRPKRDSAFTLIFIGTDFYRKGGDLVLKAFARVRLVHPDARLIMVTKDEIPQGLPLEGVNVYGASWDRAQINALYSQADVFILPSRHETWGDVLLEAMSFGLPCIGVYGQAMEEIIIHGETGMLVAPENIELLADEIIKLCEQPDLRQSMGQAARRLFTKEFTWDRVVDRLAPILYAAAHKNPVSDPYPPLS
ncbi:MAG: glycosyltransferase family 4 protein [Chloroflexi bacterium]|nr:glycosyltransferase family 4 protein [Chloroflexota bacterium]